MKLNKRTNTIILWLISIGLLVSMLIAFTPTLSGLFGSNPANPAQSKAVIEVNGQPISELEYERARQNSRISSFEGEVAEDLQLLITDNLIQSEILSQAAAKIKVSSAEVKKAVDEWRDSQGVGGSKNDRAYLNLIGGAGYDDASFRELFRGQLQQEKYRESLTEGVSVSDAEVEAFYDLNENAYQSEERIKARQIVVEDEALATDLQSKLEAGEDFAALAKESSVELADRGGALGAPEGSSDPQPIGRAALPSEVANAAFALQGTGLTDVISAGSRFHIVKVEEYIPAGTKPFEEVKDDVKADALLAKQSAVLETTFEDLRKQAQIVVPEGSTLSLNDSVVAKVGEGEIKRSELARLVYNDPQVSQNLRPDTASLIVGLFKPSYLERLIDRDLAYQGAQKLETTFLGPKAQIAQEALTYISRDAVTTDRDLQEYYDANLTRFTTPASALVQRINFTSEEAARAFREAMLAGEDLATTAEAQQGTVEDLGTVNPGSLAPELDTALFNTDAFEALADGQDISDILVITEPVPSEGDGASTEDTTATTDGESDAAQADTPVTDAPTTDAATTPQATAEDSAASSSEAENTTEESAITPDAATPDAATPDSTSPDANAADETASVATTPAASSESNGAEAASTDAPVDGVGDGATATEETRDVYVVLVAERTPEKVSAFEEVKQQVETSVLASKRSELQQAWLEGLRAEIPVENLLTQASDIPTPEAPGVFETTPLPSVDGGTPEETPATTPAESGAETETPANSETPSEAAPAESEATPNETTPNETTPNETTPNETDEQPAEGQ